MKNSKWRESGGGPTYAKILSKLNGAIRKAGIEAILEAGRWLCRWCHEFNALGQVTCGKCGMARTDYK